MDKYTSKINYYIQRLGCCTEKQLTAICSADEIIKKKAESKIKIFKSISTAEGNVITMPGSVYYSEEEGLFWNMTFNKDLATQDYLKLIDIFCEFNKSAKLYDFFRCDGELQRICFFIKKQDEEGEYLKRYDLIFCNPSEQRVIEATLNYDDTFENILIVLNESSLKNYREFIKCQDNNKKINLIVLNKDSLHISETLAGMYSQLDLDNIHRLNRN